MSKKIDNRGRNPYSDRSLVKSQLQVYWPNCDITLIGGRDCSKQVMLKALESEKKRILKLKNAVK